MNHPQYFEEFEIGSSQRFGSYQVTKEEIVEFAQKYDPQPFHLDEEAGKAMHFGGLVRIRMAYLLDGHAHGCGWIHGREFRVAGFSRC